MMRPVTTPLAPVVLVTLLLSGCAILRPPAPPEPANPLATLGTGVAAESLDTSTEAERAAAATAAPTRGEVALGTVTVSLGSPTEPGFWLRSSLVAVEGPGRVETAGGEGLAVTLLPGSGAAVLSFAAFRALGLALTDLPEVRVFALPPG